MSRDVEFIAGLLAGIADVGIAILVLAIAPRSADTLAFVFVVTLFFGAIPVGAILHSRYDEGFGLGLLWVAEIVLALPSILILPFLPVTVLGLVAAIAGRMAREPLYG
jgi:hypothetical protein